MTLALLRFNVTGIRQLLMHNGLMATQMPGVYPPADMHNRINSKKQKTADDRKQLAEVEFRGSLHYDDEAGVHMPAENLLRSMHDGGRHVKKGRNSLGAEMKRCLSLDLDHLKFPLTYDGPKDVDGLWGGGVGKSRFVYCVPARVGQSKIDRTRPIFDLPWSFTGWLVCDMTSVDLDTMQRIATLAGRMEGIGTWRARYGRYSAVVTVEQEY